MLNYFDPITVPGVEHVQVFHDDQDDHLFYIVPEFPTITKADDGGPMFNMIVFARDFHLMKDAVEHLDSTETEGALISMTTELSVSDEDQAKIRDYLQNQHRGFRPRFGGPGVFFLEMMPAFQGPIRLSYPVWVDGSVKFCLIPAAGETFVKATEGSEKPSLVATNIANYSAVLGQEGELLIREMVKKGWTPGSVDYSISFMARIPSLTIDVTGNMSDVYNEIKQHCQVQEWKGNTYYTYPQVSSLDELRTKIAHLNIQVKSTQWAGAPTDGQMAQQVESKLNDMAFSVIQSFLQNQLFSAAFTPGVQADRLGSTFDHTTTGGPPPPGNQLWLKNFTQSMSGSIDFHVSYETNLPITKNPNRTLLEILTADQIEKRIVEADLSHPFFQILDVQVKVTADFASDPIAAIKVFLDYNQKDDRTGEQKVEVKEFLFTTGLETFRFQTVMAKDSTGAPKDTYSYRSEIIYKASAQTETNTAQTTRDRALVIGYKQLNCVRVQASWGAIPTDTVQRAQVHFRYPGSDLPTAQKDIFLAPDHNADSWFTYTGGNPSTDYEYQLTFFLSDGQTLQLPVQKTNSNSLVVNAPFDSTLRVTFVPQAQFPPAASVVVSARYHDDVADYKASDVHTFTNATSNWVWQVRLRDRTKRQYECRVDVTYVDGSADPGQWQPGTDETVLVGKVTRDILDVKIVASLLDMQKTWKLVIVRLKYEDTANQYTTDEMFQITQANANTPLDWKIPLRNPAIRKFTYEIDGFNFDSTKNKVIGPIQTDNRLVLVDL